MQRLEGRGLQLSAEHVLPLMVELVIINEPPESFNIPPPSDTDPEKCLRLIRGIVTNRTTRDGHGAIFVQHTSSSNTPPS